MTKISVILPTYRKNSKEELDNLHNYKNYIINNPLGVEFGYLYDIYVRDCVHILEPTIECLLSQSFKEFEVILCHRYPEDIEISDDRIKVIPEKPSIWHDLGDYATVNNIRNTGIIHSKGELLFFLDDMTIFDEDLLSTVWCNYEDGYYTTCKSTKRIKIEDDKITGVEKLKVDEGTVISNAATWTYGMSVSMKECLKINGFDEVWDGSFGGTDMDFGRRLDRATRYRRLAGPMIYEFTHYAEQSKRPKIRNDEIMRGICNQAPRPVHIKANTWKPTEDDMDKYRLWHKMNFDEPLDPNWNKFMDVPLYSLKNEKIVELL